MLRACSSIVAHRGLNHHKAWSNNKTGKQRIGDVASEGKIIAFFSVTSIISASDYSFVQVQCSAKPWDRPGFPTAGKCESKPTMTLFLEQS